MDCSTPALPSLTISCTLPKFMSIALVMPSSHLILWHPLLLLPSVFPSLRDFSSESALHIKWPEYWSFSFSVGLSNNYSGLISLKIAWCDLLALQGTPRSLLQHHSLKASGLWHPAFFAVQLSRLCVTTGKTTALTVWIFVDRVFCFSTHCLGVPSLSCREAVIWFRGCRPVCSDSEPKDRSSVAASASSPFICREVMEPMPWSQFFFNIQF